MQCSLTSLILVGLLSFLLAVVYDKPIGVPCEERLSTRFATTLGDPLYDWKDIQAPAASGSKYTILPDKFRCEASNHRLDLTQPLSGINIEVFPSKIQQC